MLPPLYAIVDADAARAMGASPVEVAAAFLRGGVRWIQLRVKQSPSVDFLRWAEAIAELARAHDALFVINDRADVARLVGAGIHVGQDDLPAAAARVLVGPHVQVGLSTHSPEQVVAALAEPISYVAVGPVFGTRTKDTGYAPVGLDLVREAAARAAGRVPVVAIGGITLERARAVLEAGATAVAVIGDLLAGGDPESRARAWCSHLRTRD